MPNEPDTADTPSGPSAAQARRLLTDAESAARIVRGEGRWVVGYLTVFGTAALVLIPMGAYLDRWPIAVAVSAIWTVVLVVLPVWSSTRRATPFGALHRAGMAFLGFGVLYGITAGLGFTVFTGQVWWWLLGGIGSALPLLGQAVREARR